MIKWKNGVLVSAGQPVPLQILQQKAKAAETASDPEPEAKPEEKTEVKEGEVNG